MSILKEHTHPVSLEDFITGIQDLWRQGLKESARQMEANAKKSGIHVGSCNTEECLEQLITSDPLMLKLKNDIRRLESVDDPVLIRGETGTGKELIARALHGSRDPERFIAINCPALSVDLMLSEFFGHIKGAFTGALGDRVGKFQAAFQGTLFIDEIGDMPLSMQAALLRVLQEKVIVRVGDNKEIPINTRLVAATNKNLEKMVEDGAFRLDLLQRLNTFELHTVPLSSRKDDIELIIRHWEKQEVRSVNSPSFPEAKLSVLRSLPLSGNVRELWGYYRRWKVLGN